MMDGDSCNTQFWEMPNHIGTHVDAPRHFSKNGRTIDDYLAEEWIFGRPHVIDISPVGPGTMITPELIDLGKAPEDSDFLILWTGFGQYRGQPEYWQNGPGISPDMASAIRQYLPGVRALGMDMISISSLADRVTGRKAHRAFLDHDRPVLLIEDMDLSLLDENNLPGLAVIAPLQVKEADGAPCAVLARMK